MQGIHRQIHTSFNKGSRVPHQLKIPRVVPTPIAHKKMWPLQGSVLSNWLCSVNFYLVHLLMFMCRNRFLWWLILYGWSLGFFLECLVICSGLDAGRP